MTEHGGDLLRAARLVGCEPSEILDFSSNLNPLGPPRIVQKAARDALSNCWGYPDSASTQARSALADALGVAQQQIVLGAGASSLIHLAVGALRIRRALIIGPTFSEYARAVKARKGSAHFLLSHEEDDFRITSIPRRALTLRPDAVFLCNPNNPTGVAHAPQVSRDLMKHYRNSLFIVDESFMEYLDFPERYSQLWNTASDKRLMVLKSLSNILCVPGIRIGFLVAQKNLAATIMAAQEPWPVGQICQAVAASAFLDVTHFARTRELVHDERKFLFTELSKVRGLKIFPSTTNFILLKLTGAGMTGRELKNRLLSRKMLIRDCSNFHGLGVAFVRIGLRDRRDNLALAMAIRETMSQ